MTTQFTALRFGLATLGVSSALGLGMAACGGPNQADGRDVRRIDGGNSLGDAARFDVTTDAGRCPMTSLNLNPPAALRFRAYDVRYGGAGTAIAQTTVPFGGLYLNSELILPVTGGSAPDASPDASRDAALATGPSNTFVGLFQWGSPPFELSSTDDRVRRRRNGDPLATLSRPGLTNWDEAFPGTQNIGFAYTIQGRIDPNACTLNLIVLGAVNLAAGLQTNQPTIALPFYATRADGRYDIAASDFGNEAVAVFQGNLNLTLNLRTISGTTMMESAVLVVCDNNCPTINGSGVRRLEAILTTHPSVSTPDAGADSGPADSGFDAAIDSGVRMDAGADARVDAADSGTDAARDAADARG